MPGQTSETNRQRFYCAWNTARNGHLGTRILAAITSKERREGLLKHQSLKEGEGLWIAPCEAVHTFRMKFPIDIVFLDSKRRVVKLYPNTPAGRICFSFRAASVLELPPGTIANGEAQLMDVIEIRPVDGGQ